MKKEWMEGVRSWKVIGIVLVALFFSIMDPVILRFTPYMLKEFSGMDIEGMIDLSQRNAMLNFHQDIYQIFTIAYLVIMGNVWLNEVKKKTVIIPVSKGLKISRILLAKSLVYSLMVLVVMLAVYLIDYLYAGLIFGFEMALSAAVVSGILMGIFYCFLTFLVIGLSTFIYNFPGVIFTGLTVVFAGPFLAGLMKVESYTPFGLLSEASKFEGLFGREIIVLLALALVWIAASYGLGVLAAGKKEIVRYR